MEALSQSHLSVNEYLNVFGSLVSCSLEADVFLTVAAKSALRHVFGSLEKLTLSLLAPLEAALEEDESDF